MLSFRNWLFGYFASQCGYISVFANLLGTSQIFKTNFQFLFYRQNDNSPLSQGTFHSSCQSVPIDSKQKHKLMNQKGPLLPPHSAPEQGMQIQTPTGVSEAGWGEHSGVWHCHHSHSVLNLTPRIWEAETLPKGTASCCHGGLQAQCCQVF